MISNLTEEAITGRSSPLPSTSTSDSTSTSRSTTTSSPSLSFAASLPNKPNKRKSLPHPDLRDTRHKTELKKKLLQAIIGLNQLEHTDKSLAGQLKNPASNRLKIQQIRRATRNKIKETQKCYEELRNEILWIDRRMKSISQDGEAEKIEEIRKRKKAG
ncbi:hypothetical protein [Parasitella parasitica]|uniref:Uncharacterized protein n=1 Tax=Parasitella parasitica TaxID=35722 RepID=A0A0B7N342_9FUNG|nr:hypothetical protein [Parasitella parasitica]